MLIYRNRIPFLCCVALLLVTCNDAQIQAAGSEVQLKIQVGHSAEVQAVAFSPDGRWVLTGSGDGTARLWDLVSGREGRQFVGHSGKVTSVAFSPDGQSVLTGSWDNTARLWDVVTGTEIRRFEGHRNVVASVAFSPDGRHVMTGGWDLTARLWDVNSGSELRRFEGHRNAVVAVLFSRDGKYVLTGSWDSTVRLWDAATGSEIRRFVGHTDRVSTIALSTGSLLLTGSEDGTARLWDVDSGREIRRFEGHDGSVESVAFSPDGTWLVTGGHDTTTRVWDVATGREIHRFNGHAAIVSSVAFSPDGRYVLTGSWDHTAQLWEARSGRTVCRFGGNTLFSRGFRPSVAFSPDGSYLAVADEEAHLWGLAIGGELRHFMGQTFRVLSTAFSPDGRTVLTGSFDAAYVWDAASGREVRRLLGHTDGVMSVAFSPNGQYALTGSLDKTARLWDLSTGREVRRFEGHGDGVMSVAFSPNSQYALTGSVDKTARLWELSSGREVRCFEGHQQSIESVAFSPDGRLVLTGGADKTARVWDAATGRELRRFEGPTQVVWSVAFSPDGQYALTASFSLLDQSGDGVRLWDAHTGREVFRLGEDTIAFSFSPDGKWILTVSRDGALKFFDAQSGRPVATAVSFRDGGWAVADPEGRYDASDPDNSPGLYWLLGDEVIELKQLKERFYTPGLLGRALGLNKEPLPAVTGLAHLQLWPTAELIPPKSGETQATIKLTNRGGGIGNLVIKVNGRQIPLDVRKTGVDPNAKSATIRVDLSTAELEANGKNQIEVAAYDRGNLVSGRGVTVHWDRALDKPQAPPNLHAILAGVSSFENPKLNLTFPAKDALDMAQALRVGGAHLFGVDHVDVQMFATGTANEPTKTNISRAFENVAKNSGPNDVVLVYFAGHGVAGRAEHDQYYFLTREARSLDPDNDADLRAATTISSAELLEWLRRKGMPLRQVVVLDTCAAGQAAAELTKLSNTRQLTPDQRRAIELLKDRTGSHILMGATADKVSYEASRYGQGLLTYALLSAMRGEGLDEGGRLEVRKWFDTAERRVPELAAGIGGVQQPVVSSPGGQSFPIALVTKEDFPKIPLAHIKPQLLHVRCNDDDDRDPLGLEAAVSMELRASSMPVMGRGAESPLVYLDEVSGDVADAYSPRVHYWVEQDRVRLRLRLELGSARKERVFSVNSSISGEIARRAAHEFIDMVEEKNSSPVLP